MDRDISRILMATLIPPILFVIAAFAILGGDRVTTYPSTTEASFVDACANANGRGSRGYCTCVLEKFEDSTPLGDFLAEALNVLSGNPSDDAEELIASCPLPKSS